LANYVKVKVGDIVRCIILDHADKDINDKPGSLIFEVFGRLVRETEDSYELQWWGDPSGEIDPNTDMVCLVKGAVKSIKRLK
jgi:hypothetical protein